MMDSKAREACEKAKATAGKAFDKAVASAGKACGMAIALAQVDYRRERITEETCAEKIATAHAVCVAETDSAIDSFERAWEACEKAKATAREG